MKEQNTRTPSHARTVKSKGSGSLLMGVLIGLIVGVGAISVAVWYLNRAETPFTNFQKHIDNMASGADAAVGQLVPGMQINEGQVPPASSGGMVMLPDTPPLILDASAPVADLDFYDQLPNTDEEPDILADNNPDPATDEPAPAPVNEKIFLQIGAYADPAKANNIKAEIAMMGIPSTIQTVQTDTGLIHRVRVGPFDSKASADSIRAKLLGNNYPANVVKP